MQDPNVESLARLASGIQEKWRSLPGNADPVFSEFARVVARCMGYVLSTLKNEALASITFSLIENHLTQINKLTEVIFRRRLFLRRRDNLTTEIRRELTELMRILAKTEYIAIDDIFIHTRDELEAGEGIDREDEASRIQLKRQNEELIEREQMLSDRLKQLSEMEDKNRLLQAGLDEMVKRYSREAPALSMKLSDAKNSALSAAFAEQSRKAMYAKWVWSSALTASLTTLLYGAVTLASAPVLATTNSAFAWSFVLKFAVAAPLVWAAWFSARQFSYMSKIQEDYSFKVAMALTFDSYKQAAVDVDPEMSKKLMEATIGTFGENPIRIYSGKQDASTPLHDLAAEMGVIEKIAKIARGELGKKD